MMRTSACASDNDADFGKFNEVYGLLDHPNSGAVQR